jgi:hypothetical protein
VFSCRTSEQTNDITWEMAVLEDSVFRVPHTLNVITVTESSCGVQCQTPRYTACVCVVVIQSAWLSKHQLMYSLFELQHVKCT